MPARLTDEERADHARKAIFLSGILASALFQPFEICTADMKDIPMAEVATVSEEQGYGSLGLDRSIQGKTLTVAKREFSRGLGTHASSRIVQSARLNGQPLVRCWIDHREIVAGGTLELELAPLPNKAWGLK